MFYLQVPTGLEDGLAAAYGQKPHCRTVPVDRPNSNYNDDGDGSMSGVADIRCQEFPDDKSGPPLVE
jgi:hypothetical protein